MVEGGTLLRCYTSQRGIEGSNPSSSAPKAPRLQEQREDKEEGRERTQPLLHQRSQKILLYDHEFRIHDRALVSTATIRCGRVIGAAWTRSAEECLSVYSYAGWWKWTSENFPSTHSGE